MRNTTIVVLLFAVTTISAPARVSASQGRSLSSTFRSGSLSGVAHDTNQGILSHQRVQLRNLDTGELEASTVTTELGAFTFSSVAVGGHVVELIDASGKVVGLSPVAVSAGSSAAVTVIAASASPAAASHVGGMPPGLTVAAAAVGGSAGTAGLAKAKKPKKKKASPSK